MAHASPGVSLSLPAGVDRRRIIWPVLLVIVGVHAAAALAAVPWLFTWSGLGLALAGTYIFGTLGINLCYHRLLTHRGFACARAVEHALAVLGACCLQGAPASWVAHHRLHHQHADEQPDPHSPLVNFLWGHVGWLVVHNADLAYATKFDRYCRDICRDRFYLWLEKRARWLIVHALHAAAIAGAGFAAGWAWSGSWAEGVRVGASWLVWGVLVRTVTVWHITWSVNSVTHLWGSRRYETGENSRNNWVVALISNGEGWHNNHHADPRSAAHGHRWWEIDVTYWTVRAMRAVGLAWDVVVPRGRGVRRI